MNQNHEVVGEAGNPPRRPAAGSPIGSLPRGGHRPVVLPRLHHVLIERGQCDVEDQRGQDPALRGAGWVLRYSPSSVSTPALRNALTRANTRLSLTRARTRSRTKECERLSKAASMSASSTHR